MWTTLPGCLKLSLPGVKFRQHCNNKKHPAAPRLPPQVPHAKSHDGKKKRLKPEAAASSSTSVNKGEEQQLAKTLSSTPPPPPPRISVNSLLSPKIQIQLVRQYKKREEFTLRKNHSSKKNPTYRKDHVEASEYRRQREISEAAAAELAKLESKNFALSRLYKTAVGRPGVIVPPPVLLVDGYNILHKWCRTVSMMAEGQLDIARDLLVESMSTYSSTNGVRVVVVFDAMNGPLTAVSESILATGVTVVYTGDCEADSYIEEQVGVWLERRHPYVVVATSDVAHRTVVESKKGPDAQQVVFVVPASGLCKDIEATEKRLEQNLMDLEMRPVTRGVLGSAVKFKDKNVFSAMEEMRRSLPSPFAAPSRNNNNNKKVDGGGGGVGN